MTAMRLHKLLYYCQGWYLAWYGRPLFPERLEAWKYGPVVPEVYELPWAQGKEPLPVPPEPVELPAGERAAVEQVWSHYCKFSACGLRDKTHDEAPWRTHYKPDADSRCSAVIPPADLANFFGAEYQKLTGDKLGAAGEFESDLAAGRTVSLADLRRELGC